MACISLAMANGSGIISNCVLIASDEVLNISKTDFYNSDNVIFLQETINYACQFTQLLKNHWMNETVFLQLTLNSLWFLPPLEFDQPRTYDPITHDAVRLTLYKHALHHQISLFNVFLLFQKKYQRSLLNQPSVMYLLIHK